MTGQLSGPNPIETGRLTLRPLVQDDAAFIAGGASHPDVCRMISRAPARYPVLGAEIFITVVTLREQAGRDVVRLITVRKDGAKLGMIGLHHRGDGTHELGYWLAPPAWGQGIATEAGQALIAAAPGFGATQLAAGHYLDNPASGRVLDKLGFVRTGETVSLFSMGRMASAPCQRMALTLV